MRLIERRVIPSVEPENVSPAKVGRRFTCLLESARLEVAGSTRRQPRRLLRLGYTPRYEIRLFDWVFFLCDLRQNPNARFFVVYAHQEGTRRVYARIFYKDGALVWRSASHFARSGNENWIGKGDVRIEIEDGMAYDATAEETSDLPLEMQTALETLARRKRRIPADDEGFGRVLRKAPDDRIEAYADFTRPRRRAQAEPRNLIHAGRRVARFTRRGDPASLRFVRGYEPDFRNGIIETSASHSRLYGGKLERYRIVSINREIQFQFMLGCKQAWIASLQATTTDLSSYGVRTIDVHVDDDLLVPGQEYHFLDRSEDPPVRVSQIPAGFVGPQSSVDPNRADASPWLDRLPVIRRLRDAVGRPTSG